MTQKEVFIYGLEYIVKQSFSRADDPTCFFTVRTKLVFINSISIFSDKADLSHYELHFYNTLTGLSNFLKYREDKEFKELLQHFDLTGGWPHPKEGEISRLKLTDQMTSNPDEILRSFIPYFKSILEGDIHAENWFYWVERNRNLIQTLMTPMQLLKLKTNTFNELKRILNENNITHQIGHRYGWLNRKANYLSLE